MNTEITDDEIRAAFTRVAKTEDGELLYLFFQKALCVLPPSDADKIGASRRLDGRRIYAGELMALMSEGIRASGRSGSNPIVFVSAGQRSRPGHVTARQYLASQPSGDDAGRD